ncbi:hypothetical protein L6164_014038 [Bauhinia variegata]|uniref:Uncharacterized protein n=1 Tax=Bauhinia variegata TaxID=167791 RepID=A0ACB9NGU1_BAUVA|nr:hypothetical protein L6164_014038 [Bauhinia variegata]
MFPQMSFTITSARPALMFNSEAIISVFAGDKKFAHNLQTYLLSKDHLNLKSEFLEGNGKIKVVSTEQQPAVEVVLRVHVFLTVGDQYLSRKRLYNLVRKIRKKRNIQPMAEFYLPIALCILLVLIVLLLIVSRIQKLRKEVALEPTDMVEVYFESLDNDKSICERVLHSQELYIRNAIGSPLLSYSTMPPHAVVIGEESFQDVSSNVIYNHFGKTCIDV